MRAGEYQAGEFERVGRGGRRIWLQASYNPIVDANGKLCKVVKFASDITDQVERRIQRAEAQKAIDADLGAYHRRGLFHQQPGVGRRRGVDPDRGQHAGGRFGR